MDTKLLDGITGLLRTRLPGLLAVYLFGSQANGDAGPASDIDLAVLVDGKITPLDLWKLAQDLAVYADRDVDLLDLRAANTVMQYQIITNGRRIWEMNSAPALYECFILSEKTALDGARAGLLLDIQREGTVYGHKQVIDDIIINKIATIERCTARAREEYRKDPASFGADHTRQDAAVLNIQRACEAAQDLGQHLIRRERLGTPQSARDVFTLLATAGWVDSALADTMKRMVGYRNIAVHDYQTLQLPITVAIIEHHLDDFVAFTRAILLRDGSSNSASID
jgi:uncharacterized protein YutE (UPF0331/DUF86 family)/predicted nucleotidyltransferase